MTAEEFIPKNENGMYSRNEIVTWAEKYAQSKMYSEEDMIKFAMFCQTDEFELRSVNKGLLNDWKETIKKL